MTTTTSRPLGSRIWAALCAAGRCATANLATDNGWMWAYGLGYPYVGPAAPYGRHGVIGRDHRGSGDTPGRGDAEQP
jgi:hypothetical protein